MQVELNTIASSFGALSAVVSRMHEYTVNRCGRSDMVRPLLICCAATLCLPMRQRRLSNRTGTNTVPQRSRRGSSRLLYLHKALSLLM